MTGATGPDRPAVHVTMRGRVDPAVVGYALDHLRSLATGQLLETLRVELVRDGQRLRVEVTAVLAGRAIRAATVDATPRAALDRIHHELTGQAQLVTGRSARLPEARDGHGR